MGNDVVELPVDKIKLDINNPRIANYLSIHDPNDITPETIALLLGTSTDACAGLRESIRENGGIINPIVVNKTSDQEYIVIEGNTRLQIYRDFLKKEIPGKWDTINSIVYEDMSTDEQHSIRLQAHLVGPRDWDAYSKAKYLNYLANEEHMPMNTLISFCGGNSKAAEIKNMIAAYNDMELYYRPAAEESGTDFDITRFHGFVELQKGNVVESLTAHGYNKTDFSKWIADGRFSTLQDVRRLPDILKSKKAMTTFLNEDTKEAKKVLAVEEITSESLKDVPYELLAQELLKRMDNISITEVRHLRDDVDYSDKLNTLRKTMDGISFVIEEVERSEDE